jgi:hypothetical protein
MGRPKGGNGKANGAKARVKREDWFDEVIATMEVMRPLALTDSFPKFPDAKRPEQTPHEDRGVKRDPHMLTPK